MDNTPHTSDGHNQSPELVPPVDHPQVLDRLRRNIEESSRIRAAIAYWCIPPSAVSDSLVSRLGGDGFLCVDIHLPTNIDILCDMVVAGANVYLHLLDPNPQPGDLRNRLPEHLLHSKLVLFDYAEERAELWVGSHNWTNRALSGLNIEASLATPLGVEAPLYGSAERFLDGVRAICEPFDLSSVAYYKWLQGQATDDEPVWVLEIESDGAPRLSNVRLTVFEDSEEQYRNLRNVDRDVIVAAWDPQSEQDYLYKATITDTGRLSGAGVSFDSRIHGFHTGQDRPIMTGPAVPTEFEIAETSAWATVEVHERVSTDLALCELPPSKPWRVVKGSDFEGRVAPEDRLLFAKAERSLVRHPVPKAAFESGEDYPVGSEAEHERPIAPLSLAKTDMQKSEHQLLRKMVLRKRSESV